MTKSIVIISHVLFLFICTSLTLGLEPVGRRIVVQPCFPLKNDEFLELAFQNGQRLQMIKEGSRFVATAKQSLLGQAFTLLRKPGDIPAVGFHGQYLPPRTLAPLQETLLCFPVAWRDRLPHKGSSSRQGHYHHYVFTNSPYLKGNRAIWTHLPKDYYEQSDRTFPLVYVLDGQNSFDGATSYTGTEWGFEEVARELEKQGKIPEAIYVGLDNGGHQRWYEYTFCPSNDGKYEGGGASLHMDFLCKEVDPFIRKHYRTKEKPAALVGSSLGGLFGVYAALQYPEQFSSIAALSPSVWWADRAILSLPKVPGKRTRLWIDVGTGEGESRVKNLSALYERLVLLGWQPHHELRSLVVSGATHSEIAWADRLNTVLLFIFENR